MNGKALSHDKNWYLGSSRVRVVSQDHLTTTYQVEVTSPAVMQVAGIRWPLPCLPQAVIKVRSNHFHQQFKVMHPSLPEDIRKFSLATFYLRWQAKACYWSWGAPKICQSYSFVSWAREAPCCSSSTLFTCRWFRDTEFYSSVYLHRRWSPSSEKGLVLLLREGRSQVLQKCWRKLQKSYEP